MDGSGTAESSLTPAQLMELYKVAVDEYRFQVNLNAARSRDYFVLNSAIIAASVALLGQSKLLAGAAFAAGLCVAVLSGLGTHTQHNYYREARDTKRRLETRLGISDLVVRTTPSAGSRRRRFGSVTRFNYIIIGMLCVVDLAGILFSFSLLPLPPPKPREDAVPVRSSSPNPAMRQRAPEPARPSAPRRPATPGVPAPQPRPPAHP